jgi:hypothetical protein
MTVADYLKQYYNIDKPIKIWHGDFTINFKSNTKRDVDSFEGFPEEITRDLNIVSYIRLDDEKNKR